MKYCAYCGKQLLDEAVICMNCGCRVASQSNVISSTAYANSPQQQTCVVAEDAESQLAVWAKICGIVSFFVGWFILGITAIVLAQISKDESGGTMCPSAKDGFGCGIISTILSLLLFVILIAVITAIAI